MATTATPGDFSAEMASAAVTATLAFTSPSHAPSSYSRPASPVSYDGGEPMTSPTPLSPKPDATLGASPRSSENIQGVGDPNVALGTEPDAQIIEALRSKDRIFVLKLGEQMEALIKERR